MPEESFFRFSITDQLIFKRNPMFENHTGINITSSKLQLVEVNYSEEEFTIENADEEYFKDFLDFDARETKILSILQDAFDELIMRKPINSKFVSFTLPHEFFRIVELPYEKTLIQNDLIEQFKWELSVLYPRLSADEMIIQYINVDDIDHENADKAIVVAAFRRYLKLLNNFCKQNELKLKFIDNVHAAADRLITSQTSVPDDLILSVYITGNYLSVSFLQNGKPLYFNVIPLLNAGEIIPRLTEELKGEKNYKFCKRFISKAYISGENVSDSLLSRTRDALDINFIRFNPFHELKASPLLYNSKAFTERASSFAAAAGIAFRLV